jgi:hypothetical protein
MGNLFWYHKRYMELKGKRLVGGSKNRRIRRSAARLAIVKTAISGVPSLRAQSASDKITPPHTAERSGRREIRLRLSTVIVLIGICIIMASLAAGLILWHPWSKHSLVPKAIQDIQKNTNYTLYYPSDLPAGIDLSVSSVSTKGGVLVFSVGDPSGSSVIVTEEAQPPDFDTSSFKADRNFKTPYGQGYVTDLDDRTTGTLFTNDKTWLLMNSPKPIGADSMQAFITSLRPVKDL